MQPGDAVALADDDQVSGWLLVIRGAFRFCVAVCQCAERVVETQAVYRKTGYFPSKTTKGLRSMSRSVIAAVTAATAIWAAPVVGAGSSLTLNSVGGAPGLIGWSTGGFAPPPPPAPLPDFCTPENPDPACHPPPSPPPHYRVRTL